MKNEIKNAIGAHGLWKSRLQTMIDSGKTDIPVDTIKVDNQCAFGKWLYASVGKIGAEHTDCYNRVLELHAKFHEIAGRVAQHAVSGRLDDAKHLLEGEYQLASAKLTKEMMGWQQSLGEQ